MSDVSFAMEANSSQLNAVDIMGGDRVIRVRDVIVKKGDQPISVYFDGDNNRPWKPSKGMVHVLAAGWGTESSAWIGRFVQIFFEPTVTYAGKEVGGIRIRAMSDINRNGLRCTLTLSKQKREPYIVQWLDTSRPQYPEDRFNEAFDAMVGKMQSGEMTLQQVIAKCQATGDLSQEQLQRLEEAAPVDIEDGEHHNES